MTGKFAQIAKAAPRTLDDVTVEDVANAAALRDRWRQAAPGAAPLLDDPKAWSRVSTAWAHWRMSQQAASHPLLDLRAADLHGASKGADRRRRPGLFDRLKELSEQIADIEGEAARAHIALALAEDRDLRTTAHELFELISVAAAAMKAARDRAELLKALAPSPAGGTGSMTRRYAIAFDYVADEVVAEWRRLGLSVPMSNASDGGFIDLLHAMYRELHRRDVPGVGAIMARLRKGKRSRDPCIPQIGGSR